jgi:hypothetical protein
MKAPDLSSAQETPLEVVAQVARVVTKVVDRIAGDRVEVPLMVAAAVQEALGGFGIQSTVMYGPAAWIEVLEDSRAIWAGCWGQHFHFWTATQFGEVVDLTTAVAFRKRSHENPEWKAKYSPPLLWAREVPRFYRYIPEGIAEIELTEERDRERFEKVLREIREKCRWEALVEGAAPEFPNEPMVCSGRRILDDTHQTFRYFDRALSVYGIPPSPL